MIRYWIQSNCVVFITGFYELNIPYKWYHLRYESAQIIYQMPEIAPILRDFFLSKKTFIWILAKLIFRHQLYRRTPLFARVNANNGIQLNFFS